jgi:hypothetical protein
VRAEGGGSTFVSGCLDATRLGRIMGGGCLFGLMVLHRPAALAPAPALGRLQQAGMSEADPEADPSPDVLSVQ